MSTPSRAPSDPARRSLYLGLAVTVSASALGVGAALGLLYAGRGKLTLMSARHWYMRVPSEVGEVELVPFSAVHEVWEGRASAHARLSSYGWVDRDAGVIHVPLDTAIDVYVTRQREASR